MTDAQTVERWMIGYRTAWESNDPDDIRAIFTEDAVIDRAGQLREGRARLKEIPPWLKGRYLGTLHKIHNQLITVTGDTAEGETYCTAEHLERDRGGGTRRCASSRWRRCRRWCSRGRR